MEDQIAGVVLILLVLAFIGFKSNQPKRKYGENFRDAKYRKGKS